MQENVCIVLNEREPEKKQLASRLEERLSEFSITSSRFDITPDIGEVVAASNPDVLIIDYLLGDYSTCLDVLDLLRDHPTPPATIVLTDEPSVRVAVDALKAGALEYLPLGEADTLDKAVRITREQIAKRFHAQIFPKKTNLPLNKLAASSPASRKMIAEARTYAARKPAAVILFGPSGSGKKTLAQAMHAEATFSHPLATYDCYFEANSFCSWANWESAFPKAPQIGSELSALVVRIEADSGEVFQAFRKQREILWTGSGAHGWLLVTTTNESIACHWQKLDDVHRIDLPSLADRKEDIPALLQAFAMEAKDCSGGSIKTPPAELTSWVKSQEWPGQLRELRGVTIDAMIRQTLEKDDLLELCEQGKATWEEQMISPSPVEIDPIAAAAKVEACHFSFPYAAAQLGCSVQYLQELVKVGSEK